MMAGARRNDLVFAVILLAVFVVLAWDLRNTLSQSRLFPTALLVTAIPLTVIIALRLWRRDSSVEAKGDPEPEPLLLNSQVAWIFGFFLASWLVGLTITAPLMTFVYLRTRAQESWLWCVVATVALYVFVFMLLADAVSMSFPRGALFS